MNQYFDTAIKAARAAGALVMGRLKMELEWLKKKYGALHSSQGES
jgi:hypothetical protein